MMYCNNCGANVQEGTKFCPNCGAQIEVAAKPAYSQPEYSTPQQSGPYQQPAYAPPIQGAHLPRKTPIVGVLLSWFILTGSGQMYAGKIGRGFAFLGSIFVLGLATSLIAVFTYNFIVFAILMPVIAGLQIWCIIDSYKQCENYNRFIDTHGRAPTSNDDW